MTAIEFATVRPLLNISDDRIDAAQLALVDGWTLQAVGNRFNWSRQAVNDSVNVVWKTLKNYHQAQAASANLPPGWEQITLAAPSHLVVKFRNEILEILQALKDSS